MELFIDLLIPLSLTILIEYPVVQLFMNKKFVLLEAIIVNVLTNPAINIIYRVLAWYTQLETATIWTIITLLELVIYFIEAALYKKMFKISFKKAVLISFTANIISYLTGFLIF